MPLDQPAFVVGLPEVDELEAELLDGPEGPDPEQVLLQRPDEALGAAVLSSPGLQFVVTLERT